MRFFICAIWVFVRYGLDADLMVLGLLSHEPHFCLLREEVKFGGRNNKRESTAETKTWHLMSLTLFREYVAFEFESIRPLLKFDYDFERLLDDWVLLGFFVGNDFLPHLHDFHIGEDILPFIYGCYKKTIVKLDGWITDGGLLNFERLQVLLDELSHFDRERFSENYTDLRWMAGKSKNKQAGTSPPQDLHPYLCPTNITARVLCILFRVLATRVHAHYY